jgi:hypothetical protein
MTTYHVLTAYIGPETILPVTSALAAALGILLMFWQYVIGLVKKPFQLLFGKKPQPPASPDRESPAKPAAAPAAEADVLP